MADTAAVLIHHITTLNLGPVSMDMPHDFDTHRLPAVGVFYVGPARRAGAMNGLGADFRDFDVDLFVSPDQWGTGEAMRLAQRLRWHLMRLHAEGVRAIDVSDPIRRPDPNPRVRRVGMTFTLGAPA